MKWLIGIVLSLFLVFQVAVCSAAEDVTIAWDSNTESNMAGYKVYQSPNSGNYSDWLKEVPHVWGTDTQTVTLKDVPRGIRHWVVTAYNTEDDESGFSNEVSKEVDGEPPDTTPPAPPTGVVITDILQLIPPEEPIVETLLSGSGDIWYAVYDPTWIPQPVSGDFDVSIKLTTDGIDVPWEMAGILFETGPGTDTVLICLQFSGTYGFHFQRRDTVNNNSVTFDTDGNGVSPCWLRMQRVGEVFTCYYAINEGDWIEILASSGALSLPAFLNSLTLS